MPNRTDRNDARMLAQIIRTGWFRQIRVKSRDCRLWRSLLVARSTLLNEMRSIDNVVRATLWEAGLKVGPTSRVRFAARVSELAYGDRLVMAIVELLLGVRASMSEQLARLTAQVLSIVRKETTCRLLMSLPGVGPITALAFHAIIDRPERLRRSRDVSPHLSLTPSRDQSGETDIQGRISRCGHELARSALFEAAHVLLLGSQRWPSLRASEINVARRRGLAPPRGAVARKLAVILHRMWRDGTEFRFGREPGTAPVVA